MTDSRDDHVVQLIDRLFGVANQLKKWQQQPASLLKNSATFRLWMEHRLKKKKKPIDAANIYSYTECKLLKQNKHSAV